VQPVGCLDHLGFEFVDQAVPAEHDGGALNSLKIRCRMAT